MSTISAMNSSLQGMNRMMSKMEGHADRISRFGTDIGPDSGGTGISLPEEMVGMMVSQIGYSANLQVFRVADEMQGTLLDVLA